MRISVPLAYLFDYLEKLMLSQELSKVPFHYVVKKLLEDTQLREEEFQKMNKKFRDHVEGSSNSLNVQNTKT